MATLVRDDISIHFEVHGSGPTVLLTNGFSGTTRTFSVQAEAMADNYQVVLWDMRGHGQTECPDDQSAYGQDITVADMVAILDELEIDQAIIAGHSLGGFISLRFNVMHSDRVRALILQGCGPGYRSDTSRTKWNERVDGRARTILDEGYKALGGAAEVPVSLQRSSQELAYAAKGILAQVDAKVIDSLPQISVPTLVIIGEGDDYYLQGSNYMASRIPNADHIVVPNAGHGVNVDQPDIVNKSIAEFLTKVG